MAIEIEELNDKLHWYKDAIIYELHIKAFRDGNGDGIGDFEGLLEKLDYLKDLGVTAIWVLPFYPSPLKDDGYDIADYYNVNASYGTICQFQEFLKEAHNRDMKVITELVINHTSDQHPWFQRARLSPLNSDFRNFYVWSDDPKKYKDVRIIFQDFETSNWTWDATAQQFYWHRFFSHQPDLNYDNPLVQQEVFKIMDYWCKMGVDGFRLDAVPYLFEREGTNGENLPETHHFLKKLRKHIDDNFPGTLLLAEANMWPEDSASYFGNGDECHMNYHFPLMPRMFMALQTEDHYPITDIFDQTPAIPESCQWAIFLRNHDELTLEMVTDEERDYMYKMYAKDQKARINLGIRHRLAPLMENSRSKIELLNYLLFSLPGTPVLYYGDEIGMGDNFYLGDRDGVRTPMQWTSERNAGFSGCNPQKLYLPVIIDPDYHYESVNVEMQSRNTSSLLWWMKRLINKRKQYKAFSRGDLKFITCENPKILAFTRNYRSEVILVIVNLSRYTQPALLDLKDYVTYTPKEIFSSNKFPIVKEGGAYFFTLGGYDCEWFTLEQTSSVAEIKNELPEFTIQHWDDLSKREVREYLTGTILPKYLLRMRWFGGKGRGIESIHIVNQISIPLPENSIEILLIEVAYYGGLSEVYQLPLAFYKNRLAVKLRKKYPQSLLSNLTIGSEKGVLYDAIYGIEFQETIIFNMASGKTIESKKGELRFLGNKVLEYHVGEEISITSRILSGEQSNTSVIYGNHFFLKLFRKVDRVINPDVEMTHFLTEKAKFDHIPSFVGSIQLKYAGDTIITLGMMQEMVENKGDAWTYMLDRLDDFNEKVLAKIETNVLPPLIGNLTSPIPYEEIPAGIKEFIEGTLAERTRLLGIRTGEMHLALASDQHHPDFKPEEYSLHYQRSLFSGLQSLVRATFQNQGSNIAGLSEDIKTKVAEVLGMKDDILKIFKDIYKNKIDVVKIRVHGDYHLGQVLFTGKDLKITDFEGEPARNFSERRLKRSPLRDVAGMIRSFHYAAYASLFMDNNIREEDFKKLTPYVEQWYHYISLIFMKAYLETVEGSAFIPKEKADIDILMNTFLLEKAVYELNYELNNRPDWLVIPIQGIKSIVENSLASK